MGWYRATISQVAAGVRCDRHYVVLSVKKKKDIPHKQEVSELGSSLIICTISHSSSSERAAGHAILRFFLAAIAQIVELDLLCRYYAPVII